MSTYRLALGYGLGCKTALIEGARIAQGLCLRTMEPNTLYLFSTTITEIYEDHEYDVDRFAAIRASGFTFWCPSMVILAAMDQGSGCQEQVVELDVSHGEHIGFLSTTE